MFCPVSAAVASTTILVPGQSLGEPQANMTTETAVLTHTACLANLGTRDITSSSVVVDSKHILSARSETGKELYRVSTYCTDGFVEGIVPGRVSAGFCGPGWVW